MINLQVIVNGNRIYIYIFNMNLYIFKNDKALSISIKTAYNLQCLIIYIIQPVFTMKTILPFLIAESLQYVESLVIVYP